MKIVLERRDSRFFPILASWRIGSIRYNGVYASENEAISYLTGRFGEVEFVKLREVF